MCCFKDTHLIFFLLTRALFTFSHSLSKALYGLWSLINTSVTQCGGPSSLAAVDNSELHYVQSIKHLSSSNVVSKEHASQGLIYMIME